MNIAESGGNMDKRKLYRQILVNLLVTILFILILIYVVPKLLGFFLPFVIGWVVAMIANPLVKTLEKHMKVVRKWSSVAIIIVVLGTIIAGAYFLTSALVIQGKNFISDMPDNYSMMEESLIDFTEDLQKKYQFIPEKAISGAQTFIRNLDDNISLMIQDLKLPGLDDAGNIVKAVADIFFMVIVTIISAYFFIAEKDHIMEKMKAAMPKGMRDFYNVVADNFRMAIGGYFKAQLKIMVVIVLILFIGFMIIDVQYAILLAFLIGFLDFLPVFGTGTVIWPWALIELVNGDYTRAIILMILYGICQVVKQVLQPKMVGDSIGLNPLATLFFLYIGYKFGGIIGIIIGIPIGMIIVNLYRSGAFERLLRGIGILIKSINEYRKY